jgi:hypothetical protein
MILHSEPTNPGQNLEPLSCPTSINQNSYAKSQPYAERLAKRTYLLIVGIYRFRSIDIKSPHASFVARGLCNLSIGDVKITSHEPGFSEINPVMVKIGLTYG